MSITNLTVAERTERHILAMAQLRRDLQQIREIVQYEKKHGKPEWVSLLECRDPNHPLFLRLLAEQQIKKQKAASNPTSASATPTSAPIITAIRAQDLETAPPAPEPCRSNHPKVQESPARQETLKRLHKSKNGRERIIVPENERFTISQLRKILEEEKESLEKELERVKEELRAVETITEITTRLRDKGRKP